MKCPNESADGAELIVAYGAGRLDESAREDFERHLATCAKCSELARAQKAAWLALDELTPPPVSADFDARLFQRISDDRERTWWRRLAQFDWSWRPALPVAAALVVLAVVIWIRRPGPVVTPPAPAQPQIRVDQVEHALDDMDMLNQLGLDAGQG